MTAKKVFLFITVFFSLFLGSMLLGHFAYADSNCPNYVPNVFCNQNQTGAGINQLIHNIIQFVFAVAGLVVLAYIMFAGFKFITSGGDSGKKEEAQKQIVAAVIGLLIIVFSFFIIQLIFSLLGLGSVQNIELPCGIGTPAAGQPTTSCIGSDTGTPATGS